MKSRFKTSLLAATILSLGSIADSHARESYYNMRNAEPSIVVNLGALNGLAPVAQPVVEKPFPKRKRKSSVKRAPQPEPVAEEQPIVPPQPVKPARPVKVTSPAVKAAPDADADAEAVAPIPTETTGHGGINVLPAPKKLYKPEPAPVAPKVEAPAVKAPAAPEMPPMPKAPELPPVPAKAEAPKQVEPSKNLTPPPLPKAPELTPPAAPVAPQAPALKAPVMTPPVVPAAPALKAPAAPVAPAPAAPALPPMPKAPEAKAPALIPPAAPAMPAPPPITANTAPIPVAPGPKVVVSSKAPTTSTVSKNPLPPVPVAPPLPSGKSDGVVALAPSKTTEVKTVVDTPNSVKTTEIKTTEIPKPVTPQMPPMPALKAPSAPALTPPAAPMPAAPKLAAPSIPMPPAPKAPTGAESSLAIPQKPIDPDLVNPLTSEEEKSFQDLKKKMEDEKSKLATNAKTNTALPPSRDLPPIPAPAPAVSSRNLPPLVIAQAESPTAPAKPTAKDLPPINDLFNKKDAPAASLPPEQTKPNMETVMVKPQDLPGAPPAPAAPVASSTKASIIYGEAEIELPPSNKGALDAIVSQLSADKTLRATVIAYASGTPEQASQAKRTSLARALEVRKYLMDRNIATDKIDIRPLGNKVTDGVPDRVDIVVEKAGR